ncbi:MAG: hypothetical protein A3E01_05975 [Gammaproteobacteria bacterium RIFCSPHIGHO2_12_FULL_63_22]|nr:MAG: hypothetical protein A3E01_05975 [Gammaproteobacteria bacterium RIFCSPHIGHO2_12_FULL_63_22]
MHPSFSVIFFTTFSGAGYGLWFWLGLLAATGQPLTRTPTLAALALGFVMVTAGLLSSTLHLGKPLRAWRAFSQWRSSWLSREGIAAVLCYVPALCLAAASHYILDARIAGALLAIFSLATVACTAMIYASLKPIPAWRHPLVLPVYLVFALFTGGLLFAAVFALSGWPVTNMAGFAVMLGAAVLWRFKRRAWRDIDSRPLPVTRNAALGLPEDRRVSVFERPHTEANYLLREMGFVLARKHSKRLRVIATTLFALVPALLALPVYLLVHVDAGPWLLAASIAALAGTLVERWLFFAEAKHLVSLYY